MIKTIEEIEELKKKYFMKKEELNALRSQITLERWRILSEAYKIGKEIWGRNYSVKKLALDMDIPRTTVIRCLSLDKANKRTWKFIKEGKISAFQVAQITSTKNKTFQDEIVDMVIKENLSTYQLKKLKVNSIEDMNKERHRIAVEQGYTKKDSAYRSFSVWLNRGYLYLKIKKEHLPKSKQEELIKGLKRLKRDIDKFVRE